MLILKSCILPYQDIGDVFYSGATIERMKGLQTAQNKCLRTIYGTKDWPGVLRAHRDNNILLCIERRNLNLLKFAQKKSFNRCNLQQHKGRELRSNRKILLNLRMSKTKVYSNSYVLRSSKLWNNLCEDLKRIRDVKLFSTRIKKELLMNKLNFPEQLSGLITKDYGLIDIDRSLCIISNQTLIIFFSLNLIPFSIC